MSFVYCKIENIKYNDYNLYYKKPIVDTIALAEEFNDKYTYFFKCPITDKLHPLGKFKYRNDFDSEVYEFTEGFITLSERDYIYCKGIPESGENMILVEGMFNLEFPVYYHALLRE
jgi:hypothetical protein